MKDIFTKLNSNIIIGIVVICFIGLMLFVVSKKHRKYGDYDVIVKEIAGDASSPSNADTKKSDRIVGDKTTARSYNDYYSIIDENFIENERYSINVRLKEEVSENKLTLIAKEIRNSIDKKYKRVFIVYYLPGMIVGGGGWATSHFNPELEVKISGLTPKEIEQTIEKKSIASDTKIVGKWIDDSGFEPCVLQILDKEGQAYLSRKFRDGSGEKKKLALQSSNGQVIYTEDKGTIYEVSYVIDRNGDLTVFDSQGLIFVAPKSR